MIGKDLIFTIFGSTGDLSYRKLFPALYHLEVRGLLDSSFKIRAIGRRVYSNKQYHAIILDWIKKHSRFEVHEESLKRFFERVDYVELQFTDLDDYKRLRERPIAKNNLYYFAVAPSFFMTIGEGLASVYDLSQANHRIILEKPFGDSLKHAVEVHEFLKERFGEKHIYHIDHYLGKEMIQNILALRFSNRMFEQLWSHEHIEQIQISVLEELGIESRASYYEQAGAVKDMVQNHLLQILSYVVIEDLERNNPESLLNAQTKVFERIQVKDVVLGQYQAVQGIRSYRDEDNVDPESTVETYAAIKLQLDSGRMKDVPIYIRSGKRLNSRQSYIKIVFKRAVSKLYDDLNQEILTVMVHPDEGFRLQFNAKKPGSIQDITEVSMDFCQSCLDENRLNTPEAYERLLHDVMLEDSSLFTPWPVVEQSWILGQEMVDFADDKLYFYDALSDGPDEADEMLEKDGFKWLKY